MRLSAIAPAVLGVLAALVLAAPFSSMLRPVYSTPGSVTICYASIIACLLSAALLSGAIMQLLLAPRQNTFVLAASNASFLASFIFLSQSTVLFPWTLTLFDPALNEFTHTLVALMLAGGVTAATSTLVRMSMRSYRRAVEQTALETCNEAAPNGGDQPPARGEREI